MNSTQLTSATGYDVNRMIFSDPIAGSIPDSKPAINYKRISISTINSDGTTGDLILPTETCFSFGVGENTSLDTGKSNGFVFPICLYDKDGATEAQKEWVTTFNNIVEKCKDYLLENKEELEQFELERGDLKKLNCLYMKRERGKIVENAPPTLYAKLLVSKKNGELKILSTFFDLNGDPVDPLTLQGKYCTARAAIKIESIFIGNKISLQVKLYECEVKILQSSMPRLLSKPKADTRVLTKKVSNAPPMMDDDEDIPPKKELKEDAGSLVTSDNEGEPKEDVSASAAPIVRKVVRKVKKVTK